MLAKLALNRLGIGLRGASYSRNARLMMTSAEGATNDIVSEWRNLSKFAGSDHELFLNRATAVKSGLEKNLRYLESASLIGCVETLADWDSVRETIRGGVNFREMMADPKFGEIARRDRVLIEIAALLYEESFNRLWHFTESKSPYINETRVLVDLSKAWTKANTESFRWASFPACFIYKWYVRTRRESYHNTPTYLRIYLFYLGCTRLGAKDFLKILSRTSMFKSWKFYTA